MNHLVKNFNRRRSSLPFPKLHQAFCIQDQPSSSPSSDTLYDRLQSDFNSQVSITRVIDEWVAEGRPVELDDLKSIIERFRKYRRHSDALQVLEWTSDKTAFEKSSWCKATQLQLIEKLHGVEQAEMFFDTIPYKSRALPVHGALLNCYVKEKSLEKAEAIMNDIRKFKHSNSINYNAMLKLYTQMGKHDKLVLLMQEMENKGVAFDEFSYNIMLNSYASTSDVKGMEKLLMKMEVDPFVTVRHITYMVAAKVYMNSCLTEKALDMLKKAEYSTKDIRNVYQSLMTYYAAMGKKEEVYRLWNQIKKAQIFTNMNHLSMVSSLVKLGDIDGAYNIFEEWDRKKTAFDIRIPNVLIFAYCKKGNIRKANSILRRVIESDHEPDASTWSRMALGYCMADNMDKAVEMTKRAFVSPYPFWKPDMNTVAACLEYLKKKGDVDGAKEIMRSLEKFDGPPPVEFTKRIERYIHGKKKPNSEAPDQTNTKRWRSLIRMFR